jgi:hypothetical protein
MQKCLQTTDRGLKAFLLYDALPEKLRIIPATFIAKITIIDYNGTM